ncbi:MAG: MopE-related protein, partial [Deltaproteobacteria bacterium]
MVRPRRTTDAAAWFTTAFALAACGAKTQLRTWDAAPVEPECQTDEDCSDGVYCDGVESCHEGRCVPGAPVVCTDGVECTDDSCNESARACVHAPASHDADGDGYNGPRPGHRAGDTGACGDDCNDANASIHPGATEFCNGIIDDNATFTPAEGSQILTRPANCLNRRWAAG